MTNVCSKVGRIKLLGLTNGEPHEFAGQYIISYDASVHLKDGSYEGGELICTPDAEKATVFDLLGALKLIKASPACRCHGWRADGLPHRPLSAFDIEVG